MSLRSLEANVKKLATITEKSDKPAEKAAYIQLKG